MANGDLVKLGTLYLDGTKQARPTRPWRTDSKPPGAPGVGNIPHFSAGKTIEIRNTDASDTYKIQWREVNKDGKKYLIADRNLLVSVSWDDLNAQNLIFGKNVTIDGHQYKLRVLTGGTERRELGTDLKGGKLPNEWDEIIVNESNFPGLPKPSGNDFNHNLDAILYIGAHNEFWNWYRCYSLCQDVTTNDNGRNAFRGHTTVNTWGQNTLKLRHQGHGWRPVLEVLSPMISGNDEDLGDKKTSFSVPYSVAIPSRGTLTIREIVNGSVVYNRTGEVNNTFNSSVSLDRIWSSLPTNRKIEIKIEVTDSNSNKSVRTYTFVKTNSEPTAVPVEPKGDLVNIAIADTINPVLVWRFEDTDPGDAQSAYQVIVEDTNGNTVHDSKKIASSQSFYIVPDLSWATRYKWKARVWDRYDLASNYSSYQFFLPKRPPNVTDVEPGSPNAEEPAGTGTAPEFSWTFEDLDQQAQAAYQLRIYDTKDTLIYDSGRIEKTINMHKVPEGVLTEGTIYYAVVTVWDPFHLHKDSAEAYFVTNSTPTAPTLTSPANTYRTGLRPTFEGLIGTDKENDPQHFVLQLSQDEKFEEHVLELSSMNDRKGWQVSDGSQWYDLPEEGVDNSYEGKGVRYTLQVDLDEGRTYYWRMAGIDANTKARGKWSSTRCIRCGNTLQFKLKNPISTGNTAARRILIAADYYMANDGINKAQMKMEVTNNALDTNPVWEDATNAYQNADYFTFTNTTKTAQQFALDIRVTFVANDSLGAIEMRGLGFSFD